MTEDQRQRTEKELRDSYRDLSRKQQEVQDDFNARRNEEMSRLQKTLIEEVRVYAKAQNFDLVIADGVIYSTPTLDITPAILTALQAARARRQDLRGSGPRSHRGSERRAPLRSPVRSLYWLTVWRSPSGELAVRFGCELRGDPDTIVEHVATLAGADSRSLSFLANPRYKTQLAQTHAGAVVLDRKSLSDCPTNALICANPHAAYARIAAVLHPRRQGAPGIHATAIVAESARVDPTATHSDLYV